MSRPSHRHIETRLTLLLVDDESRERSVLRELCERSAEVEIIGEAASGAAALEAIENLHPDLLLLEVELPDMSGFDVLRTSAASTTAQAPSGILVTAHAQHAVTAFEAGALDCLLKPVSPERLAATLRRVRTRAAQAAPHAPSPPADADPEPGAARWLVGEREHRLYPLDPRHLEYIEADGNYVKFHTAQTSYIRRDSLKRLEAELGRTGFLRIGRSLLVNAKAILYLEALGRRTFEVRLRSGTSLHSSARYREEILSVLPLTWPRGR